MSRMLLRSSLLSIALILAQCSTTVAPTFTISTSLSGDERSAITRDCDREPCTGSPASMKIKLYQAYGALAADCSGPLVTLADHGTTGQDISIGVDRLVEATPAAGTYNCLILRMSDNLKFVPDSTAIAAFPSTCTGAEATHDIYRSDSGDAGLWKELDGSAIAGTGTSATPGDNTVVIYQSTSASALAAGTYAPHENQSGVLTSALTVPGQTTFYVDFRNGIAGASNCRIEGGRGMGFR